MLSISFPDDFYVIIISNAKNIRVNKQSQLTIQAAETAAEPTDATGEATAESPSAEAPAPQMENPLPDSSEILLFRTDKHLLADCKAMLMNAIMSSSTKAEAVRKMRQLCMLDYLNLNAFSDTEKAKLINHYSEGRFVFHRYDFQRIK